MPLLKFIQGERGLLKKKKYFKSFILAWREQQNTEKKKKNTFKTKQNTRTKPKSIINM